MRRNSPVQQWLDSLPGEASSPASPPPPPSPSLVDKDEDVDVIDDNGCSPEAVARLDPSDAPLSPARVDLSKRRSLQDGLVASTPRAASLRRRLQRDHSLHSEGNTPKKNPLLRDYSLQSDGSGSSGSSVLNVLGARRVDAEALLIALGFGPSHSQQQHQRIPERFLVPSKLKGISTEQFIKNEQHSMRMHDCGVFGYRGLTGSPHVPPSTIVAKIIECISQGDASVPSSPHQLGFGDT